MDTTPDIVYGWHHSCWNTLCHCHGGSSCCYLKLEESHQKMEIMHENMMLLQKFSLLPILIQFTTSQHGSILRNPREVCSIVSSLHIKAIVLESGVVRIENIPVSTIK